MDYLICLERDEMELSGSDIDEAYNIVFSPPISSKDKNEIARKNPDLKLHSTDRYLYWDGNGASLHSYGGANIHWAMSLMIAFYEFLKNEGHNVDLLYHRSLDPDEVRIFNDSIDALVGE